MNSTLDHIVSPDQFFDFSLQSTLTLFSDVDGGQEVDILLTGIPVKLKFAGSTLMPLVLPAISHLVQNDVDFAEVYTIYIWDAAFSGIPMPKFTGSINDIKLRGEIAGFNDSRFQAAYLTHARMLNLLDIEEGIGIVCFADSGDIPAFEMACPLRSIFSWIIKQHGKCIIHGGAVATAEGAVLIGGQSGSGKSSTSLRCLAAGMEYLGDDLCAISETNNVPTVFSLYSSGKTHSRDLVHFPEFTSISMGKKDAAYDKQVYLFEKDYRKQLPLQKEIKAVIIPDASNRTEIAFLKTSLASVLSVMCSSTRILLPGAGNETFFRLSSILHKVPCYKFTVGPDPAAIPDAIRNLIRNLNTGNE